MKTISNLFDAIGRVITSLSAVIFVMLMVISGMIFFSHTLFNSVFPGHMQNWEKMLSTWLMAMGWEFTVLLTTCNTRHINKRIPAIMAIASGIIVLFFIQAFDQQQSILIISQRWFVGLLAATINYIYAELFYAKWVERNMTQLLPSKLIEAELKVNQLQSKVNQLESTINEGQSKGNELNRELNQLRDFKKKINEELTCPHCKQSQPSYGTLHAHKGHCQHNPKKVIKKIDK